MSTPAPAPTKPFGRTQKIAMGAMAVPLVVASVALFTGKASFGEWSSFVNMGWLTVVVPLLGAGMTGKVLGTKPAAPEATGG